MSEDLACGRDVIRAEARALLALSERLRTDEGGSCICARLTPQQDQMSWAAGIHDIGLLPGLISPWGRGLHLWTGGRHWHGQRFVEKNGKSLDAIRERWYWADAPALGDYRWGAS